MTKKELLEKMEHFDDDAVLLFSDDMSDFRDLESDACEIFDVLQVYTGAHKYIVFTE